MNLNRSFQKKIQEHWDKRSLPSFLLLPFALFYSLIQYLRRKFFSWGLRASYRSPSKIISIGNLGVGGNGKTPFTIYLAKYLRSQGFSVAVSHRGYKGEFENSLKIISGANGVKKKIAIKAGDEPQELARNLTGIPVIVGKNRTNAIKLLEQRFQPDYIILDDSFQHLRLKRDIDFVMFDAKNPLANGFTIPAGKLREPKSALKYADLFVFNNCPKNYHIPKWVLKYKKPILKTIYKLSHFVKYSPEKIETVGSLKNKKVFLLSGIGNPKSFENSILNAGIFFSDHFIFPDHQKFDYHEDVQPIMEKAKRQNAEAILTTEKDYVKLKNILPINKKFFYAKLEVEILGSIREIFRAKIAQNTKKNTFVETNKPKRKE